MLECRGSSGDAPLRATSYSSAMLHGRDDVISMVRRWLDGVEHGAGGAVHLVGVAGVGKSAMLEWTEAQARARSMRVLRVTGHPEESRIAWGGVSQMATPFLPSLEIIDDRPRSTLLRVLRLGDSGPVDDVSVAMSLLLMLTRSDEPLIVTVDDTQWLDRESQRVFAFVARRLLSTGVGMIAAGHPDGAVMGEAVDLLPLRRTDLHAIARDLGVTTAVAEVLADQADGLPLVLEQMVAGLDESQRRGLRPLPEPITEVGRVDEALITRIEALADPARRLLAAAALAPSLPVDLLTVAARVTSADEVLADAITDRLVMVADDRIVFPHPTVRAAATKIPADDRRDLHSRLAEVADVGSAGWHLAAARAGPDDSAARALDALAADAEARGAHSTALRARQTAIECSTAVDVGRLLATARSAIRSRLPDVADALIADLVPSTDSARIAAESAWIRGDVGLARRRWTEISSDESVPAEIALGARRDAARAAFRMYDMPGVGTLVGDSTDPILRLIDAGQRAISGHPGAGDELAAVALAMVDQHPDEHAIAALAEVVTLALARSGRVGELEVLSERVGDLANEHAPHVVPALLIARASHRSRSDLIGSIALARDAMALAEEWELLEHRPFALGIAAIGEASTDGADAMELAAQMRAYGVPIAVAVAAYAEALVHYGRNELEEARACLLPVHDEHPTATHFGFFWHHDLVDIALRLDDRTLAEGVAADLLTIASTTSSPWVKAAVRRVDGLLAVDPDEMDAAFADAAERFASEGYAISAARCRLDWAERLRRTRRRARARAQIELARPVLLAGGARRWVGRCDVEAAALGLVIPEAATAASTLLTPRELQVARWLVSGLTFKQIGTRLFLSPRTVEAHGQTVYRKLGVRGRAELAQLAQRDPSLAPPPG
jgi:DNA-binding CsgD family transcriptional regulator